ncbi:MAG TPA: tagaturonate epimerase family protein, partial [Thermoclostridium sp.]|nr:tagaturonate epimerase family protein [Thermoclostridium sp.]
MSNWKDFLKKNNLKETKVEKLKQEAEEGFINYGVYPRSINEVGNAIIMMARGDEEKYLLVIGEDSSLQDLKGSISEQGDLNVKVCPLSNENCNVIRTVFPYTNPQPHKGKKITVGLGDRLGLASPGHIETVEDLDVFPVLAQQSIRELNLTGRTYEDVISAAAWAVFQEGYTKGYGADGDHLKTAEEVKMSLDVGMTMITLDCSEHIDNSAVDADIAELKEKYEGFPVEERKKWEERYSNKSFSIGGFNFDISGDDLIRLACVYGGAIHHTLDIYHNIIAKCG